VDATLDVYQHYNPTNLTLSRSTTESPNVGGLAFATDGNTTNIQVKIQGNIDTKIADHFNEIKNCFSHEEKHYDDYLADGYNIYHNTPIPAREYNATKVQIQDPTFQNTRKVFQESIIEYGNSNGLFQRLRIKTNTDFRINLPVINR